MPWMYGRRRLTRVEMAVYAVIVATLVAVFSSYVLDYMEMAEKATMDTTLANVTSAINVRYALLVMSDRRADSGPWLRSNPFELANVFPPNYRGVFGATPAGELDRPAWLFDLTSAELVYFPRLYSHLNDGEADQLRFRLQRNPSGFGFMLVPTSGYTWDAAAFAKLSQIASKSGCTPLFS